MRRFSAARFTFRFRRNVRGEFVELRRRRCGSQVVPLSFSDTTVALTLGRRSAVLRQVFFVNTVPFVIPRILKCRFHHTECDGYMLATQVSGFSSLRFDRQAGHSST